MSYGTYDTPGEFFGPGYSLASSEIKLSTSTNAGVTVGTFTVVAATDVITTSAPHGLQVGHRVTVSSGTTLPAGLTAGVEYYVLTTPSTTTLTLSLTSGGAVVDITDTGTGTHTMVCPPVLTHASDTDAALASGSTAQTLFAILDALEVRYGSIPTADKPTKFNIRKTAYLDPTTGEMIWNFTSQIRTSTGAPVAINS